MSEAKLQKTENFEVQERITFKDENSPISSTFLVRILHNNFRIKVQESPSCNCQLFSIAPFQRLVMKGFAYNPEIYPKLMEFITELSRICGAGKRLCQIDIKEQLYNGIKDHVNILSEMKYKNLTGTNMVGLIIKI